MVHRRLALIVTLAALAGGNAGICQASDPRCETPVHCAVGGARDPWAQISGPQFGFYATRWRPMPEVMGLTGDVLPIPIDTTRKVPTIPVEGGPPAGTPLSMGAPVEPKGTPLSRFAESR
jgi:hypothetical protein